MTRLIVLTDIHGCIKELESLLGDINPGHSDEVVCLGDITDKGPDPISCIRLLINSRAVLIASNHDERYAVALRKKKSPSEKYISLYNELVRPENEDCAEYLKNKLAFYQKTVGRVHPVKLTFIHGGVTPHNNLYNLSGKDYNEIFRARYVDKHGNFVMLVKGDEGVFREFSDCYTLSNLSYSLLISLSEDASWAILGFQKRLVSVDY
jgi:predicted phosphodiesterase